MTGLKGSNVKSRSILRVSNKLLTKGARIMIAQLEGRRKRK
nr:MAG TPA: hypothetical protein [Caudoviricetes sp.]